LILKRTISEIGSDTASSFRPLGFVIGNGRWRLSGSNNEIATLFIYIIMIFSTPRRAFRYNECMAQIEVQRIDDFPKAVFDVTVSGESVTRHRVVLTREYYEKLTADAVTAEELVEESFEYLLAREPNTSILHEFDLKVITKYFSGYEQEMQSKLQAG